jgi:signal transduction histidine kinase
MKPGGNLRSRNACANGQGESRIMFGFGKSMFAATRRKRSAERRTQARFVAAAEHLNDGVALIDAAGRIVWSNPRITSMVPACVTGEMLPQEFAPARPDGEMQQPDGRWLRISRGDSPDGGFMLIITDITLAKRRELRLRSAQSRAESADRDRIGVLANLSHELRTPLNAVIGLAEIIANDKPGSPVQPRYRDFAADIVHSGRHLLDLVNDILDVTRLQSGANTLRLQSVCLARLAHEAVRIVHRQAEAAGVKLVPCAVRDVPRIEADHLRLRQVLLNLLSNAIKFTPAGGTVTLAIESHPQGVRITVRDTGIGMAPADIPRALQPFVQLDSGPSRRGGTGLGLPLARLFVEQHGGRFDLHSVLGKGTTATVLLPVVAPARELAAA